SIFYFSAINRDDDIIFFNAGFFSGGLVIYIQYLYAIAFFSILYANAKLGLAAKHIPIVLPALRSAKFKFPHHIIPERGHTVLKCSRRCFMFTKGYLNLLLFVVTQVLDLHFTSGLQFANGVRKRRRVCDILVSGFCYDIAFGQTRFLC